MTARLPRLRRNLRAWMRCECGAVLVEFAVVISLFFFLFFGLLDFGRLIYSVALAEKATYLAARTAVVRPPACAGVPDRHASGTVPGGVIAPRFGTSCSVAAYVCAAQATVSCAGSAANPTAQAIWTNVAPLLPPGSAISVLQFTYEFDANLGFLGGPYTPMVTVQINLPDFQYISPLGAIANAAGANNSTLGGTSTYPGFNVSLPGEDLAQGNAG